MKEVGFKDLYWLLSTYAVQASDLRSWLAKAQINRDRNLRLQYLAGMGLNQYLAPQIYNEMLERGSYPSNIFSGSADKMRALRDGLLSLRH
jgi:spermidine synthase